MDKNSDFKDLEACIFQIYLAILTTLQILFCFGVGVCFGFGFLVVFFLKALET